MQRPTFVSSVLVGVGVLAVLSLSALSALAGKHDGHHEMRSDREVILDGEVIDLYCFMKHPEQGQGPDHAKCAKNCIRQGLPIGFLSDGEVYLLIGKEHESVADLVVELAGVQARLTGILIEHNGVKSIELKSIEKLPGK